MKLKSIGYGNLLFYVEIYGIIGIFGIWLSKLSVSHRKKSNYDVLYDHLITTKICFMYFLQNCNSKTKIPKIGKLKKFSISRSQIDLRSFCVVDDDRKLEK